MKTEEKMRLRHLIKKVRQETKNGKPFDYSKVSKRDKDILRSKYEYVYRGKEENEELDIGYDVSYLFYLRKQRAMDMKRPLIITSLNELLLRTGLLMLGNFLKGLLIT